MSQVEQALNQASLARSALLGLIEELVEEPGTRAALRFHLQRLYDAVTLVIVAGETPLYPALQSKMEKE